MFVQMCSVAFALANLLDVATSRKILVSSESQISIMDYVGKEIVMLSNYTDILWNPSWLQLKDNSVLYATDEIGDRLRTFEVCVSLARVRCLNAILTMRHSSTIIRTLCPSSATLPHPRGWLTWR